MGSLRSFHLVFMLIVIVGADLFGAWAVHEYVLNGDRGILAIGIISLVGGFGLIIYAWQLVRGFEAAKIR